MVCAGVLAVSSAASACAETDEKFTSGHILKWEKDAQNNYFSISIGMAGAIAAQNKPEIARCIDNWYFNPDSNRIENNSYIRSIFGKYPNDHPSALMLAIIQKKCGKLVF